MPTEPIPTDDDGLTDLDVKPADAENVTGGVQDAGDIDDPDL